MGLYFMFNQDFLPVWLCSVSTPASEPLNPLWRVSASVSDCRMNLIQFYRESTILFLWRPIDIVLFLHLKLNFCSIYFYSFFSDTLPPSLKMSHHKNSWKDKVGTSFRSFLFFFLETYWEKSAGDAPSDPASCSGWLAVPAAAGRGCSN